jgi:hypothetical protein
MCKRVAFSIFLTGIFMVARSQCSIGPTAIPDNNASGVSYSFTNQAITNWANFKIQILFNPEHTWAGDLRATVVIANCGAANGTYTLFNFQTSGVGSSCDMNGTYTFQATGSTYLSTNGGAASNPIPACSGGNLPAGTYTSAQQWPTTGSCSNATITVTIFDNQAADVGSALVNLVGPTGCFPIPVKLISFAGKSVPGGVELNWTTAQEINSSHFVVEYSTDYSNWLAIGNVQAAGYSSNRRDYTFFHAAATAENNFYRLRQVDLDGRTDYSNILLIKKSSSNKNSLQVTPNPATAGNIQLQISSTENYQADMMIIDFTGKIVFKTNFSVIRGANTYRIPATRLAKGGYMVLVKGDNFMLNEKLVIQ